jgi:hypothetical protein
VIVETADHTFLVLDQAARIVHVYGSLNGTIAERSHFRIEQVADDMCAMGNDVYILAYANGDLIHEYDRRGHAVKSFGIAPGTSEPERAGSLVGGAHLTCASQDVVVLSRNVSSEVIAYDRAGQALWTFTAPHFRAVSVRTLPDGTVRIRKEENKFDVTFATFGAGSAMLAIQVSRGGQPDAASGRDYSIDTYLVRLSDGNTLNVQRSIPEIQGSNDRAALATVKGSPVRVFPMMLSGGGR